MSPEAGRHDEESPVRQEPDRLPVRGMLIIGAVVLLVLVGGIAVSGAWWWSAAPTRVPERPEAGRPPVPRGDVFQRRAAADRGAARGVRPPQQRLLEGFGWVDRDQNLVRIPIEEAIEIYAGEGSP